MVRGGTGRVGGTRPGNGGATKRPMGSLILGWRECPTGKGCWRGTGTVLSRPGGLQECWGTGGNRQDRRNQQQPRRRSAGSRACARPRRPSPVAVATTPLPRRIGAFLLYPPLPPARGANGTSRSEPRVLCSRSSRQSAPALPALYVTSGAHARHSARRRHFAPVGAGAASGPHRALPAFRSAPPGADPLAPAAPCPPDPCRLCLRRSPRPPPRANRCGPGKRAVREESGAGKDANRGVGECGPHGLG